MTATLTAPVHRTISDVDITRLCAEHAGLSIEVVGGVADIRFARPVQTRVEVAVLRQVERLTDLFAYHGGSPLVDYADRAEALLSALGSTKERVGAVLAAMHVTGYRGDAHFCPLATYLRSRGLPVDEVMPSDDPTQGVVEFDVLDGVQPRGAYLTAATNDFGNAFDQGAFPALERVA